MKICPQITRTKPIGTANWCIGQTKAPMFSRSRRRKVGHNEEKFHFIGKTFGGFEIMSYLCTRKTKRATNNGAVVQLVRILACHARGRGFEPRPHRKRGESEMVLLFFLYHANLFRQVLKISFELYDIYLCHRFNIWTNKHSGLCEWVKMKKIWFKRYYRTKAV